MYIGIHMFAEATKAGLKEFKKKVVSTEKSKIRARLKIQNS